MTQVEQGQVERGQVTVFVYNMVSGILAVIHIYICSCIMGNAFSISGQTHISSSILFVIVYNELSLHV